MEAEFSGRPLLNRGERRLLSLLDKILAEESPGRRAMGQVSLGELLASPNEAAFFAVNSKRVELLLVDADCRPLPAGELDRKRVVWGRGVSVSVVLVVRRILKKK